MPAYDFRCKDCETEFTLFYKSFKAYDAATPACTNCQSTSLARVIKRVNVNAMTRDYSRMSSNEMLSVLESGDSQQVNEMVKQVGAASPEKTQQTHEQAQKILGKADDS